MKSIKIKAFIIICLISLKLLLVYSQDTDMPIEQHDIDKLNKRVFKLFKKATCKHPEGIKVINVFFVYYNGGINKKDFINTSLEQNFEPAFFYYKSRKYLKSESFICKDNGELIALSDGRRIYCLSDYNDSAYLGDKKLIREIIKIDLDAIYYLYLTPLNTYFGINKNGKVFFIRVSGEQIDTYLIEEISDNEWYNLFKLYKKYRELPPLPHQSPRVVKDK